MSVNQSVLTTRQPSLAFPILLAMLFHGALGVTVIAAEYIGNLNRTPIADVEPVMVTLRMKTDRRMVQKAVTAPRPAGVQTPKAVPDKPVPPKVSKMQKKVEEVEKAPGVDVAAEAAKDRKEQMRKLLMAAAIQGAKDSEAADPDSEATETIDMGSGISDPELARYEQKIKTLFQNAFKPLPNLKDMDCVLSVKIDQSSGRITESWVSTSSNNASYDAACERAAATVGTLPLPPEKYAARYASGYKLRLNPKN